MSKNGANERFSPGRQNRLGSTYTILKLTSQSPLARLLYADSRSMAGSHIHPPCCGFHRAFHRNVAYHLPTKLTHS